MDITRLFVGIVMLLPVGLVLWLVASADAWLQLNGAGSKLSAISSSLYGSAPPRVKVKSIQVQKPTSSVESLHVACNNTSLERVQ